MSQSRVPQLPEDYEELDFIIEEEGWNEYELSDNSHIKARTFLTKVVRDPNNPNEISFNTQPAIYIVYAPVVNRGERNNAPQPTEYNTLATFEIRILRNDERWNRYRILRTGQIVRMRLMVTEIRRIIDRYDNDGLPFYLVASGMSIMVTPPQASNIRP
jgi:hypothetical protein